MKVCVVGAGGVGGLLAAVLRRAGVDVSLLVTERHLAPIRRNGLSVIAPTGRFTVEIQAEVDPRAIGACDVVIVTAKMWAVEALAPALRPLLKDKWFTLAAIVTLALGIGTTSAVFTLVNAVLLRTLPFDEPERIMMINTRDAQGRQFGVSEPDFEDWRRASRTFSGISLVQMYPVTFSADELNKAAHELGMSYPEHVLDQLVAAIDAGDATARAFDHRHQRHDVPGLEHRIDHQVRAAGGHPVVSHCCGGRSQCR